MPEKYIIFDFETTGFSAQKNEIIQIGAVKYDENDQEIARFNQLIKPQRSYVSTEISNLTGIWQHMLLDQPVIEQVLPDFLDFIQGHLLVAHNAPFDVSFLYQAIIDCGIKDVESFRVYDTLSEAKRLLSRKSYKLESFKDMLDMSDLRSHDALNDCLITAKLYQYLQRLEHQENAVSPDKTDEQLDLFADFADEDAVITDELRRKLGLPITKALVYYRRESFTSWQKFSVDGLHIERQYSTGYSLSVTLSNHEKVLMHSDFLKEMQKANFLSEMGKE